MRKVFWSALVSSLFAVCCQAAASGVQIESAWARATPPGAGTAAAYLRIANPGNTADTLLGASTDVAPKAELHTHVDDKGVMRMRQVASVALPAGQVVDMQPGGLHVMLIGLGKPLAAGQQFILNLQFERAGTLKVPVKVEPLDFHAGQGHQAHH